MVDSLELGDNSHLLEYGMPGLSLGVKEVDVRAFPVSLVGVSGFQGEGLFSACLGIQAAFFNFVWAVVVIPGDSGRFSIWQSLRLENLGLAIFDVRHERSLVLTFLPSPRSFGFEIRIWA